jgi:hypothetical protein
MLRSRGTRIDILRELQPFNSTTKSRNATKHVKSLCSACLDMLREWPRVDWSKCYLGIYMSVNRWLQWTEESTHFNVP